MLLRWTSFNWCSCYQIFHGDDNNSASFEFKQKINICDGTRNVEIMMGALKIFN